MHPPGALHLLEVGARSHDSLSERLGVLHGQIRRLVPAIDRLACALYEAESDELVTFVHSTLGARPLHAYRFRLADSPSLAALVAARRERVIDDMHTALDPQGRPHTRWLFEQGYRSSYTLPLFEHERLLGVLFFDACTPGVFEPAVCEQLRPYASLVPLLLSHELAMMRMLVGSIRIAQAFANLRDLETGGHLQRMAAWSRLIALRLAGERGWDDEFIEHVYLFAPLHDIGKVGVPDEVLHKPGRLDAAELALMMQHVAKGEQIVEEMVATFGLEHLAGVQVLRQIVAAHHECPDGSGYPRGLRDEQIPDAARIVAVADVFDALRHARPYKPAWSHAAAAVELRRLGAAGRLDLSMVEALLADRAQLEAIRERYREPADPE